MKIINTKNNADRTVIKFDLLLEDNYIIQNVFFISKRYNTLSLSTQVGCPVKCSYCASGKSFIRNLSNQELVEQLLVIEKYLENKKMKIESIKLFGIGEPLLNIKNVVKFIRKISGRYNNISICTIGICQGIDYLIKEKIKVELFVSLNGISTEERIKSSKFFEKENFRKLINSIKKYEEFVGKEKKVQINYLLLDKINDSAIDMQKLGKMFSEKYKINLKKQCLIKQKKFKIVKLSKIKKLQKILNKLNKNNYISKSKGKEIYAAQGQLEVRKWN